MPAPNTPEETRLFLIALSVTVAALALVVVYAIVKLFEIKKTVYETDHRFQISRAEFSQHFYEELASPQSRSLLHHDPEVAEGRAGNSTPNTKYPQPVEVQKSAGNIASLRDTTNNPRSTAPESILQV